MNRCIQCYRCVRFYRQYAGGNDLNAFSIQIQSSSGATKMASSRMNLRAILSRFAQPAYSPTAHYGTHYTRKWDLRMAPSICGHCGIGCNVTVGERYGLLRRVVNRFNSEVNGYFLCDRGRFAYEFVNSPDRIRMPQLDGEAISGEAAEWEFQN